MGTVESGTGTEVFVSDLDTALPDGGDIKSWGDDNIRFLKQVVVNSLPVSYPVGAYDVADASGTNSAILCTVNTNVAITSPAGMEVFVKAIADNPTGGTTLQVQGTAAIGATAIKRADGDALKAGDIRNGMICHFRHDGTNWQLLNPWKSESEAIQNQGYVYAADTGAADAYVVTLSPIPDALTAGLKLSMKVANDNTGACNINVNGLGATSIKMPDGTDPAAGDLQAGGIAELTYDGTNFQLTSMSTIARGASPDTQVKITSSDTTTGYLDDKIVGGQVENAGGNEKLSLDSRMFFFAGF